MIKGLKCSLIFRGGGHNPSKYTLWHNSPNCITTNSIWYLQAQQWAGPWPRPYRETIFWGMEIPVFWLPLSYLYYGNTYIDEAVFFILRRPPICPLWFSNITNNEKIWPWPCTSISKNESIACNLNNLPFLSMACLHNVVLRICQLLLAGHVDCRCRAVNLISMVYQNKYHVFDIANMCEGKNLARQVFGWATK